MIYFSIVFFCTAGLFLLLLEDRFRVWTTLISTAVVFLLSLGISRLCQSWTAGEVLSRQLPCALGISLFFLASLVLHTNNTLQKLFLALLSLSSFTFLELFVPLFLGVLPFQTAGVFGGVFSAAATLLFYLLLGLCLYRPIRHYSDRGPSCFLAGMCLLLILLYVFCLGGLDFLFPGSGPFVRVLWAALIYSVIIFGFRSLYQAGRFREQSALHAARNRMLEMEHGDFEDMLTAVREVRSAQKAGEYALDTVNIMLVDGWSDKVPEYIAIAKQNSARNPILETYHENPYLNAVIATKAAFAAQNSIAFESNAGSGDMPLNPAEVCVIVNEILTRACQDAAAFQGRRSLRFTMSSTGNTMSFEAVYSAVLPVPEKLTLKGLKGKKVSEVAQWLFEEPSHSEDQLQGLENTAEIIGQHSGKLSISAAGGEEVILQASLKL